MATAEKTTERKIRHVAFTYYVPNEDRLTKEAVPFLERLAYRGETVALSPEDIERGERFDAFYPETTAEFADGTEERAVEDLTLDETLAWIQGEPPFEGKPNVQDIVDAAGGDPITARKLLDAENAATGNDPRAGVLKGLTAVIQGGGE